MRSCAQIAKRIFLLAVAGMNLQAMYDAPYRIRASTVTMRRFGPSGSCKKKNNVLEHRNAVITRRSKDFFVDANGMVLIMRQIGLLEASEPNETRPARAASSN